MFTHFSPDGKSLATGNYDSKKRPNDRVIVVSDVESGIRRTKL